MKKITTVMMVALFAMSAVAFADDKVENNTASENSISTNDNGETTTKHMDKSVSEGANYKKKSKKSSKVTTDAAGNVVDKEVHNTQENH